MIRQTLICLIAAVGLAGCTYMVPVKPTEEYSLEDCTYIGTFEALDNPGQVSFGTLKHYADTTTVEFQVKMRAYKTGATHLVWLYQHSAAAGAMAYRCPDGPPAATEPLAALDVDTVD